MNRDTLGRLRGGKGKILVASHPRSHRYKSDTAGILNADHRQPGVSTAAKNYYQAMTTLAMLLDATTTWRRRTSSGGHDGRSSVVLRSLTSEDINGTGAVEVRADLLSSGRQDAALEPIVNRLSLEPR